MQSRCDYGSIDKNGVPEVSKEFPCRPGKCTKSVISILGTVATCALIVVIWYTSKDHSKNCIPMLPGPPAMINIYNTTESVLCVRWGKATTPNISVAGYKLYLDDAAGHNIRTAGTDQDSYIFDSLDPWTDYVVSVVAYTLTDPCLPGTLYGPNQTATARTKMIAPTAPSHLHIGRVTNSSVEVAWDIPAIPNGPINGYVVRNLNDTLSQDITTRETRYVFQNLVAWSNYTFSVKAFNVFQGVALYGPVATIQAQVEGLAPSAPVNPAVKSVTSTSISLSWEKPVSPNGPLNGYVLNNLNQKPSRDLVVQDTNYVFHDLVPWTEYTFSIRAFNDFRELRLLGPDVQISGRTNISSPSAPTNLAVKEVTKSSVKLNWAQPVLPNGPLDGYIVSILNTTPLVSITVKETTYAFVDLKPWTKYTFSVSAFNVFRDVPLTGPPVTIAVQTGGIPPPYSFGNLSVSGTGIDSASLVLPLELFSTSGGPILDFILLVERSNNEKIAWNQGHDRLDQSGFLTWTKALGTNQWYRTSPVNWNYETDNRLCKIGNKGTRVCVVGLQKICMNVEGYCNGPLKPQARYWAKLRAYTENGWTETFPVSFTTASFSCNVIVKPSVITMTLLLLGILHT